MKGRWRRKCPCTLAWAWLAAGRRARIFWAPPDTGFARDCMIRFGFQLLLLSWAFISLHHLLRASILSPVILSDHPRAGITLRTNRNHFVQTKIFIFTRHMLHLRKTF